MAKSADTAPRFPWKIAAPFGALALIAGAYSVFWFMLAGNLEEELLAYKGRVQENGVKADWRAHEMHGFPYRMGVTLKEATLTRDRGKTAWSLALPEISAQMLPYRPGHFIVDVNGEQDLTLTGPDGKRRFISKAETLWGSYVAGKESAGRLAVEIKDWAASGLSEDSGTFIGSASAGSLQLHTRPAPDPEATEEDAPPLPRTYDLALKATDIAWDFGPVTGWLEPEIALFEAQMRGYEVPERLPADLDTGARAWAASGGRIAISDLQLLWGPIDMKGQGELTLDAKGRPSGRIEASFGKVEELIARLVETGIVKKESAPVIFAGAGIISALQGKPQDGRMHLPLAFHEGVVFLGPVSIGRLEPLY
mgnify:FL=1